MISSCGDRQGHSCNTLIFFGQQFKHVRVGCFWVSERAVLALVFASDFVTWPFRFHSGCSSTDHLICFSNCSSREKIDKGDNRLILNSLSPFVFTMLTFRDDILARWLKMWRLKPQRRVDRLPYPSISDLSSVQSDQHSIRSLETSSLLAEATVFSAECDRFKLVTYRLPE